jgi:hypothetical protein
MVPAETGTVKKSSTTRVRFLDREQSKHLGLFDEF